MKYHGTERHYVITSDCERYRYETARIWSFDREPLVACCLNPSTINDKLQAPLLTKMEERAFQWCKGGFVMINLYGYITKNPHQLFTVSDPVGPENDEVISRWNGIEILGGWGARRRARPRAIEVQRMLHRSAFFYLDLTTSGQPMHPQQISYDKQKVRYTT